ncbi:MAG TPA: DoxX family protein [Caulobacteraceae bacterium]|nr:DoxX family protein [Caulobacteraceae bacterium]
MSPKPTLPALIAAWVLKALLAVVFLFSAAEKLSGQPVTVAMFDKLGLGQWFRYVTGSLELVGALLLMWPKTSFWGALALLSVCIGAGAAQLGPLHGDIAHVIVLGLLVLLAAWIGRPPALKTTKR